MTKHASTAKHASQEKHALDPGNGTDEKHALGHGKHAFAYTADECGHLRALRERALDGDDADWFEPGYWHHCAAVALDMNDAESHRCCIEQAEALECGMTHGGETL